MHIPSPVAAKIRESFALYAVHELDRDSALYEVIHVARCLYGGKADLAQAMLMRDIERNFEKYGEYVSSFSYRRYKCCRRAEDQPDFGKMVAGLVAAFGRPDYVRLIFS